MKSFAQLTDEARSVHNWLSVGMSDIGFFTDNR